MSDRPPAAPPAYAPETGPALAQTEPADLRALVRRLRPVVTDRPLVRLGPDGDGGYLVPDDLGGVAACFSPGVSTESGFERDCAERGMDVFLADKSVDGPAEPHARFHFTPQFVGATVDDAFTTLDAWVDASGVASDADLLLQMDVEGYEYEALLAASPALLGRFRVVALEVHFLEHLWDRAFFHVASRTFAKLLAGHACVHAHPNNYGGLYERGGLPVPGAVELTFLRRDRIGRSEPATAFPHPLDRDNGGDVPPVALPAWWYA